MRLLLERGHRRIAVLLDSVEDHSISQLRFMGCCRALGEYGLRPDDALVAETGSFEMAAAYRRMTELLRSGAEFSAVFCVSDSMAVAAMKALEEAGMAVPRDCSVIGIDGVEFSQYTCPTLTTLCQPKAEMGRESVRILLERIQGRGGHRLLRLPTYFREGASVRYL